MTTLYHHLSSPWGEMEIKGNDQGLESLAWVDLHPHEEKHAFTEPLPDQAPEWLYQLVDQLNAWFEHPHSFSYIPLDLPGTPFQKEVWALLQTIPVGQTRTYTEIAEQMGRPQSHRAVAMACAANYAALVIPCHRVVHKSGHVSGYRWGPWRKEALLELEKNA